MKDSGGESHTSLPDIAEGNVLTLTGLEGRASLGLLSRSLERARQRGLGQRVEMQLKPNDGG